MGYLLKPLSYLPRRTFERLFGLDLALGGGEITNGNKTSQIQGVFYVKGFHKPMKYIFIILFLKLLILNGVKSCLQCLLTLYFIIHGAVSLRKRSVPASSRLNGPIIYIL